MDVKGFSWKPSMQMKNLYFLRAYKHKWTSNTSFCVPKPAWPS